MKLMATGGLPWCRKWNPRTGIRGFIFIYLAVFGFFFPAISRPVTAASDDIELELLSPPVITAEPREIPTLSVQITSHLAETLMCEISAVIPSGWGYATIPDTLYLEPDQPEIVFISIMLPDSASAGEYPIALEASFVRITSSYAVTGITVIVPETPLLDLKPDQPEKLYAASGQEIIYRFTLSNIGNVALLSAIEVDSQPDWACTIHPTERSIYLEPDQSEEIEIICQIPEILDRSTRHWVTVTARSTDSNQEILTTSASSSAEIIASQLPPSSLYASLDGEIEINCALSQENSPTTTLSFNDLETRLADGSTIIADIRNILIDGDKSAPFTQNERITVEYHDIGGDYFRAGDGRVNLYAPLMDRYLSGKGIEMQFIGAGADSLFFHVRTRSSNARDKTGFQIALNPSDIITMRLTTLRETGHSVFGSSYRESGDSTRMGLVLSYDNADGMELEGETCYSNSTDLGLDNAWRLHGRYRTDQFLATCEWLRAGPMYQGGWEDIEMKRVNLSWSPLDELRFWMNYYESQSNLDYDPEMDGRMHRNLAFSGTWNVSDLGRFRASHRVNRTGDVLDNNWTDLTRVNVLSFSRNWDQISTTASWQEQVSEGMTVDDYSINRMFRINCSARINRNTSIRLGVGSGWDSLYNGQETYRVTDFDFGGRFEFDRDFSLSWDMERYIGGSQGARTNLYGRANWELSDNREISFRVRYYSWAYGDDTEMMIQYVLPVSLPLPMFPVKGGVRGRIFYAERTSEGIPYVVVYSGEYETVTNQDGEFSFPALDPGDQYLGIDNSTLDVGLVPTIDLPVIIGISAGSTSEIEIPVIRTGSIEGWVYFESDGIHSPLADYPVELTGPGGTFNRYTTAGGGFRFSNLIPGNYSIMLLTESLPPNHEALEPISLEIEIAPGETVTGVKFIIQESEREFEVVLDVGAKE